MGTVIIIGAGFAGLSAALELSRAGHMVTVLEAEQSIGGLAGSFVLNGHKLEKFYHHWFTSDREIDNLASSLLLSDRVISRPTRTGTYYANSVFRLSRPLDLLRYRPLGLTDRLRLGYSVLAARRLRDWHQLEHRTAMEWMTETSGKRVYATVWQPLLEGKFGPYAPEISAVWLWNKLVLRGSSRGRRGEEVLRYFKGGFVQLAEAMAAEISRRGGRVLLNANVRELIIDNEKRISGVRYGTEAVLADAVIATMALPLFASLVEPLVSSTYASSLRKIGYLSNRCLVLALDRPLSSTYWMNVADPSFPFVGLIEHTNLDEPQHYGGDSIVYLSKYISSDSELVSLSDEDYLTYAIPFIRRIFPDFSRDWILQFKTHFARYAQPIVVREYGRLLPSMSTPIENLFLCTMAQIYPEDRGTNYAVREGRKVARLVIEKMANSPPTDE